MKVGRPAVIFDPAEWLPPEGESRVAFNSVGLGVTLSVEYEKCITGSDEQEIVNLYKREIIFGYASYFMKFPIPGRSIFQLDQQSKKRPLGPLIEFLDSEFAESCQTDDVMRFNNTMPKIRHFSILFLSENLRFDVLAEEYYLSDEIQIDKLSAYPHQQI